MSTREAVPTAYDPCPKCGTVGTVGHEHNAHKIRDHEVVGFPLFQTISGYRLVIDCRNCGERLSTGVLET